jgi:hypothetical protein
MRKILIFTLCLFPTISSADGVRQIFDGKIGNSEVIFDISKNTDPEGNTKLEGRYFYKKHRKIIDLKETDKVKSPAFVETEYDCYISENNQCPPHAILSFDENWLQGEFKSVNENSLPIKITLREIWNSKNSQNRDSFIFGSENLDPLDPFYAKLVDSGVVYSNEKKSGLIIHNIATDKFTKISYPYIVKFPNEKAKDIANKWLDTNRNYMVLYGLDCLSRNKENALGQGTLGGWDEYSAKIDYIAPNFMTISEGGSTFCGGAHPNNTYNFTMWDFVENRPLDLKTYFNFYTPNNNNDYELLLTKNYKAFLKTLNPRSKYALASTKDKEMYSNCFSDEFPTELSVSLNGKGVLFSLTDLPHVIGACMDDYYLVPYKDIAPLMTPLGKKFFANQMSKPKAK